MNEISNHAQVEFSGDIRIYKDSKGEYMFRINYGNLNAMVVRNACVHSNPISILDKDLQEYVRKLIHKWVDDEFSEVEKEDA